MDPAAPAGSSQRQAAAHAAVGHSCAAPTITRAAASAGAAAWQAGQLCRCSPTCTTTAHRPPGSSFSSRSSSSSSGGGGSRPAAWRPRARQAGRPACRSLPSAPVPCTRGSCAPGSSGLATCAHGGSGCGSSSGTCPAAAQHQPASTPTPTHSARPAGLLCQAIQVSFRWNAQVNK